MRYFEATTVFSPSKEVVESIRSRCVLNVSL